MPNVIGMNLLQATAALQSATNGEASITVDNADNTGIVSASDPPAGFCLDQGLATAGGLALSVTLTT